MNNFTIDIIDHHWIDNDPNNQFDNCSHGKFMLTIGGQEILSDKDDIMDWTTNTSVLRLLRTLDNDFIDNRDMGIILHCGMIHMISCPIAVDWILVYKDGKVIISDIKKYLTTNDNDVIDFKGLTSTIEIEEYRCQIIKIALEVKEFFAISKPRKYYDGSEMESNWKFWEEFDLLLEKHSSETP
ncbi:MAG: hypothetical protein ABI091_22215 [Ferruginibacter sp.]